MQSTQCRVAKIDGGHKIGKPSDTDHKLRHCSACSRKLANIGSHIPFPLPPSGDPHYFLARAGTLRPNILDRDAATRTEQGCAGLLERQENATLSVIVQSKIIRTHSISTLCMCRVFAW